MMDITAASVKGANFFCIDIETEHADAAPRELQCKRQADIPKSDDGDGHGVSLPELRAGQKRFSQNDARHGSRRWERKDHRHMTGVAKITADNYFFKVRR